ncbi:MAG: hypothetical protein U9N82_05820, partial [Thermodesulfobacteriota bacterium]|nr:hypothetical protein [Thermodesulfobacteriota bacterium]
KIVSDISELNAYAYCGHSAIMAKKKRPWQDMGYSLADLARLFGMTGQGVGYAVQRGERIAKQL